jgi:nucleotide-binding universal stress UspA family protein
MTEVVPAQCRILVGIDGSECAERALLWAVREARLRAAVLDVVHVAGEGLLRTGGSLSPAADWDSCAAASSRTVERLTAMAREHGATVQPRVEHGRPEHVLVRLSKGADLLVLGSSGHTPLLGMLLGSVAQHCTRHAHCPVVLVPLTVSPGVRVAV